MSSLPDPDVRELAERLGRSEASVREEVRAGLREIAAHHSSAPMATWRSLGRRLLRGYQTCADNTTLAELRRLDDDHTLVWLPSHRSYLDTWALPLALDAAGFPPYFVFGGANLDFWPFGDLARRTGLVFIRRNAQSDPVYRFALRKYIAHLVREHADFGWSIEGGRTRTGKLRPPRYGLLRYLSDVVREEDHEDVLLVPTSIVWDGLQEVPMMVAEARGQSKRPEDLRWLFEFGRRQRVAQGRVHIDFAEPVPLARKLRELESGPEAGGHEVERVALEVSHRINSVTPATTAAIVTVALLAADRALSTAELVGRIAPLIAYIDRRQAPRAPRNPPDHFARVEEALRELARAGAATCVRGRSTVWAIGADQHLVAAFYRNTIAHLLVTRAIAELVAGKVGSEEAPDALEQGLEEALRLRDLLKFEFFFARKRDFVQEVRQEVALLRELPEPLTAPLILRPFLEAYNVVADELATREPAVRIDTDEFLKACLALGRQWQAQRYVASLESVSLELFRTALKLARHRRLWEAGEPGLGERRRAFRDELRETLAAINALAAASDGRSGTWR